MQPPTNLQYSQPSIAAVQGTAITTDKPAVTGTVSAYSVSPALPAGLSLDPSSGAISGTPTTVAASASYTVKASNSAGSTTASITISVALAAPSNLSYPQATIAANVGKAIATDTPTVNGTVTGFSINPALPTGLIFNTTTGAISGTPTSGSPQTTYTVTASNSTGSTAAQVTITVTQTSSVLLELGHGSALAGLHTTGDHILSEDVTGHWNLWDYTSGKIITSGDGALVTTITSPTTSQQSQQGEIALAGQVAVVQTSSGINVLSASDGSTVSTIPSAAWWMLATDGSYLCTGSTMALTVYSTSGQTILTHSGDYHAAVVFAAQGQLQIALGAAGANVVETLTVPSGTSTVSAPFNGAFFSWFLDGGRFLTNVANTVYTYSNAGTQQAVVTFPKISNLSGQGNWIWIAGQGGASGPTAGDLQVYAIGSNTPAVDLNISANAYLGSGMLIAAPDINDTGAITLIDLSGSSPVVTNYKPFGISVGGVFASASTSQWVIDGGGSIVDGATVAAANVRTFGYGRIASIAATPNLVALAASNGQILLMDPSTQTVTSVIDSQAYELEFSSDGSIVGAASTQPNTQPDMAGIPEFTLLFAPPH